MSEENFRICYDVCMNSISEYSGEAFGDWSELDAQKFASISEVCANFALPLTEHQILVNIDTQRLHLIESQKLICSYLISTALNGVGQKNGTGQTPLGLHFVQSKIGEEAEPFEVFKSRVSTGEIAKPNDDHEFIVGRILWLQGAEPGFNQGNDSEGNIVDTHDRYIYIHGTNDIAHIGEAVSAGCIRMMPNDVINLFQSVAEKTPVYIYQA